MVDGKEKTSDSDTRSAWQAPADTGAGMNAMESLLALWPTDRVRRHGRTLAFVRVVRQAGMEHYGFDPRPPIVNN